MPLTEEEQAKARRAQNLLYAIMAVFILAPLVLYLVFGKGGIPHK